MKNNTDDEIEAVMKAISDDSIKEEDLLKFFTSSKDDIAKIIKDRIIKSMAAIEIELVHLLHYPDPISLGEIMDQLFAEEIPKHNRWILSMLVGALRDSSAIESAKQTLVDFRKSKS